jgi:hypothetical protein
MYCVGPDRKAVIYKFVGNALIKSLHEQAPASGIYNGYG